MNSRELKSGALKEEVYSKNAPNLGGSDMKRKSRLSFSYPSPCTNFI